MKSFRYRLFKRIFIYCLCTTLIFSNIFISYSMTVCAIEYSDLLRDGAEVALSALGIYATVQSGGALSLPLLIPYIERLAGTGFDVYDYITQNEDGTTTISEDFVQLVLQAYKECVEENFDGNIHQDESTMYYVYGGADLYLHTPHADYRRIVNSFTYAYPVAYLFVQNSTDYKYMWWGQSNFNPSRGDYGYCIIPFAYNGNPDSSNGGIFKVDSYPSLFGKDSSDPISIYYQDGEEQQRSNSVISGAAVSSGSVPLDASYYATISTSGIPVYTSFDMMREDFYNGNYTHADNYGGNFGQTSSYTGTYGGGDITIPTVKLDGIQDKLDEIDKTDKGIDDKLKELLDWLKENGGSDNEGPGGSTGDCDGLLDLLSSYFNSVLAKLDAIIQGIDGLLWFESTEDDEDDPTNDLADMLKKILDDPQTGSQEVADSLSDSFSDVATGLTKKFPFSIPWDVYGFFNVFANVSSPPPQTRTASYDDRGIMLYPAPLGDDIRILAGDTPVVMSDGGRSATDAPYFELPIVVESFGIDEVIIVDLEGFTSLSTFSRVMLSCIFGIFLIKWTIAFISAFNEIMPGFFDD